MRSFQPQEIKVTPLDDEERLAILREIPSIAAKTLDECQIKLLLSNEVTRNPLYLIVALEELRGYGSFEQLNQEIARLPQTSDPLTDIFRQVIHRLGEDFNALTVKDVLTLLVCSRHGLSERELLDFVEGKNVNIEESTGDLFPILRQLRPFLHLRGSLLDFFHRHLAKAILKEFLETDNSNRAVHLKLADYFSKQQLTQDTNFREDTTQFLYNQRKLIEQTWQFRRALELSSDFEKGYFVWQSLFKTVVSSEWVNAIERSGFAKELVDDFISVYSFAIDNNMTDDSRSVLLALLSNVFNKQESFKQPILTIENVHLG